FREQEEHRCQVPIDENILIVLTIHALFRPSLTNFSLPLFIRRKGSVSLFLASGEVKHVSRHRPCTFFLLVGLIFLVGPTMYAAQLSQSRLTTPWFVPILATLGVFCMVVSVLQRRGLLRTVGLVICALLCAFEWFMILVVFSAPSYSGPAQV